MTSTAHRRVSVDPGRRRAFTWNTYRRAVAVTVAAVFVFRLVTLLQWGWFVDDWIFFRDRDRMSFSGFVLQGYNSHLMPGQFVVMWVMGALAPLNHAVAAVITATLAATGVLFWAMAIGKIFGERVHLVAALVVMAFTPTMTGVTLWWSSGLPTVVMQNVMGLSIWFLARWLTEGRQRTHKIALTVTYVTGLLFWEKCVLVAIPLVFVVVLMAEGPIAARLKLALRALWPIALIGLGYLVLYVSLVVSGHMGPQQSTGQSRSAGEIVSFYYHGIVDMLLPALVGGPFDEIGRPGDFYRASPVAVAALLAALAIVGALLAMRSTSRAAWALAMPTTYLVIAWGLILFNRRFGYFGNDAVRAPNYLPDILAVLVLAVLFLLYPRVARTASPPVDGDPPARGPRSVVTTHAFAAVALVCVIGTGRAFGAVAGSSPKPYFDTLRTDAENVGVVSLYKTTAPADLVGTIILPGDGGTDSLLEPLGLPIAINQPTDRFVVANDDGNLVLGRVVDGAVKNKPGDTQQGGCPYSLRKEGPTTIPLEKELFPFGWVLEITYFAEDELTATVSTEETTWSDVVFPATDPDAGISTMQFAIEGPATDVVVDVSDAASGLCITELQIGLFEPTVTKPPSLNG